MGISHLKGKYGNMNTVVAMPDGHTAGNRNGHEYSTDAVYEIFQRAGYPLLNDCGEHVKPKGDGPYVCISGLDTFGKMQVLRPQDMLSDIMDGVYAGGILGSDIIFNAFPDSVRPFLVGKSEKSCSQLLDFEGHEKALEKVLRENGFEYVLGVQARPTISGFAFPADWLVETDDGKIKITRIDDMKEFAAYHCRVFRRRPVLAAEYPRFAGMVLVANDIQDYTVVPSTGSTENRLRGRADAILETVETGSGLARADARLLYPAVSLHLPALIMRKDAPKAAKDMIYELKDVMNAGKKEMESANPNASRIKLDYRLVGWDENGFRLPEPLDRMRAANY